MRIYELTEKKNYGILAELDGIQNADIYQKEPLRAVVQSKWGSSAIDFIKLKRVVISEEMKDILISFDPKLFVRSITIIYDEDNTNAKQYWMAQPQFVFALHESTEADKWGRITNPILRKSRIKYDPVFYVPGLYVNRWFINLEVAEYLLRYGMSGFELKEVQLYDEIKGESV